MGKGSKLATSHIPLSPSQKSSIDMIESSPPVQKPKTARVATFGEKIAINSSSSLASNESQGSVEFDQFFETTPPSTNKYSKSLDKESEAEELNRLEAMKAQLEAQEKARLETERAALMSKLEAQERARLEAERTLKAQLEAQERDRLETEKASL